MSELPEEVREKCEEIPEQIEVDLLYQWSDEKFDRSNALDLARECSVAAATAAWEHATELVCEMCGATRNETAPINGWCNKGGNYCIDNTKITRAQYEFERRKEGR